MVHKRNNDAHPKNETRTPDSLYQRLDARFHFVRDVAATTENSKCDIFMSDGGIRGTVGRQVGGEMVVCSGDAMKDPWNREGANFCNPPYKYGLQAWLEKAKIEADEGAVSVVLLPVDFSTPWWDIVMLADEWIRIKSRVKFYDADGKPQNGNPMFSSVVAVFAGGNGDGPKVTEMDWKGEKNE